MYKIILAAMVPFFFISCSEKVELSDYIKKSEYQIENGTISVTIDGTTTDGLKINETIVFNCDDIRGSHYYVSNDSTVNISIHRYNILDNKSLIIYIKKENEIYALTGMSLSSIVEKQDNSILDISIYSYHTEMKNADLKVDKFDPESGILKGSGSYLHQAQVFPDYYDCSISFSFDLKLREQIYD
ncbi:MAG: hypothetical protein MI922_21160 [Bacteroidales bacterium]|nr:hypothetical protein [Bacteroidales bacterium]